MKDEIAAAVVFVTKLVKKNPHLSIEDVDKFQNNLTSTLLERFKNHWYETTPSKGQAYRCIRINDTERVDPVLEEAAHKSGLRFDDLGLPCEMTLWVDPTEVSCRLGENRGAFCTVALFYDGCSENRAKTIDIDKILAHHFERKQVEFAKFVKATSTRTKRCSSLSRSSPPVVGSTNYNAGLPPQCHGASRFHGNSWEEPRNGYHSSEQFYDYGHFQETPTPSYPAPPPTTSSAVTTWGNWGHQSNTTAGNGQVSPNGNSASATPGNAGSPPTQSDLRFNNSNAKKVRMATGGAHLTKQSQFSSQQNKFRWVKPADAARA